MYATIAAGWGSARQYSAWGALRGIRLAVRYEIPLVIFFFRFSLVAGTWDWGLIVEGRGTPLVVLWVCLPGVLSLIVIEFNRAPFDLVEAERELVRGFNTEYGAVGFILLFIAEYARVVIGCQLMALFITGGGLGGIGVGMFLVFVVLIARAAYPRVKTDILIDACWKRYLPMRLFVAVLRIVGWVIYVFFSQRSFHCFLFIRKGWIW